ncbi:MAG: LysR family transcriptional regulator [Acidaminococcus sp.]|nr:LysR family transcriptional regulator [Acidaminococcus sp.]MCI2115346.1 LysR family transcriptional regulator [Acidaminococcus sp.]MCI2117428.1 LysR family transcriptional regulator [Acidaminococcus sp.]
MDRALQKYHAFLKTVETGNITKAALELSYSQSSVSKMIADLEKEWDIILFDRGKNGVSLTSDGKALLPAIRSLLASYENLNEQVSELSGLTAGTIRVGLFASAAEEWMPNIIRTFQRDYPQVRYELQLGDYDEIETWIENGTVDCGFLLLPTRSDFYAKWIEDDELVAALPPEHPLTKKEKIAPEDLNGEPFLLLEHGGKTEVSHYLEKYHVTPDVRFTTWDDYAIMAMVEKGLGIGLLHSLILKRMPYHIAIRPLTVPARRQIGIAMKDLHSASKAVQKFLEYIKYRNEIN